MVIILKGQCPSGKNSVVVTRSGMRFPNARFKRWREDALLQIGKQLSVRRRPIFTSPINVRVVYSSADNRRRDVPGIIDALWHLLEKAGVVSDDTFLGGFGKTITWENMGNTGEAAVTIVIE